MVHLLAQAAGSVAEQEVALEEGVMAEGAAEAVMGEAVKVEESLVA